MFPIAKLLETGLHNFHRIPVLWKPLTAHLLEVKTSSIDFFCSVLLANAKVLGPAHMEVGLPEQYRVTLLTGSKNSYSLHAV